MVIYMDLNASPLPEHDEVYETDVQILSKEDTGLKRKYPCQGAPETSVQIMFREREERRQRLRLKQENQDDGAKKAVQPRKEFPVVLTKFCDRNQLPPGWLDCPAFGENIGLIIPSKVPLSANFDDFVVPGKRYSTTHVLRRQRNLRRELGLVIDLTNTSRYYSSQDWREQGIVYKKIACKGRDSVPDNELVNQFVYEVSQYLDRQKHSKKYVLVHCTHGHNRTGYMIVHFLMRSQAISVTEAIQKFASARPPGIYKPDYIDALYEIYHEKKPDAVCCPPTPEWKRSLDFDLNSEALPDDDGDHGIAAPLQEEVTKVMTNDDILGDAIPSEQQRVTQTFCYQFLKLNTGNRACQFPGSHPVSLNRENLQLLRQRRYYATWKADGTRYMMLIMCHGCYLTDRKFCFRRVQMRFPLKQTNEPGGLAEETHNFTLLDGEMVIDTLPTGKKERRYLIYDLIAVNRVSVVDRPFYERWKMLETEVIEPRNLERKCIQQTRNPHYRYEMEPFRVRRKDFWLLTTVRKLLKEFIPTLPHEADGLIFQGMDDPYVPRTHEGLLKWKYAEMNSVDFLFEVTNDNCQLLLQDGKKPMKQNQIVFRDECNPLAYSGKIIECSWDSEGEVWVFMRIRTDKRIPNNFNTYQKVMQSIKDNITEEVLLNEVDEIMRLPMYADKIRSDSKVQMHHKQPLTGPRR